MKTKIGLYIAALALGLSATIGYAQQPGNSAPSLHELLQGDNFPLGAPVPEKPDPMRLYKEGIATIAKEHIALTGYAPTDGVTSVMGLFGFGTGTKKTKMQAFLDKWEKPPFELKTLDDADRAIKEALNSLDFRFDSYLVPKDVKLEDKRIDNTNVGIGIIIKMEAMDELLKPLAKDSTEEQVDAALLISDKHFLSVSPVKKGPAAKGGMLEGDVIKEIAGKSINGMTYNAAVRLIKGKKQTKVDITVERIEKGSKVLKKLTITRDEYEVPVVTLKDLGNGVWHLQLETFAARNAAKDVKEALDEVMKKGGKKLIFDLRDNGGGLVDQAIDIAMYMLPEGTIVTQQHRLYGGADVVETQSHVTTHVFLETRPQSNGQLPIIKQRVLAVPAEMPIVILVNGHSASASELVSGALRFNNRVKMVGTRTFGKGVGQALLDLPYGRRLHVTSFYFLPANRFTDWVGIEVDVEAKAKETDKTDTQLEAAIKTVNEMYDQGIKDAAAKAAHEEEIRKENRELWKQRLERQKKFEEEMKKQAEDKAKDAKAKKEAEEKAKSQPKTAPESKKPEGQKSGTDTMPNGVDAFAPAQPATTTGGEAAGGSTPATKLSVPKTPPSTREVLPTPSPASLPRTVPTDPTNPSVTPFTPEVKPMIDPKPDFKPGEPKGPGNP